MNGLFTWLMQVIYRISEIESSEFVLAVLDTAVKVKITLYILRIHNNPSL